MDDSGKGDVGIFLTEHRCLDEEPVDLFGVAQVLSGECAFLGRSVANVELKSNRVQIPNPRSRQAVHVAGTTALRFWWNREPLGELPRRQVLELAIGELHTAWFVEQAAE